MVICHTELVLKYLTYRNDTGFDNLVARPEACKNQDAKVFSTSIVKSLVNEVNLIKQSGSQQKDSMLNCLMPLVNFNGFKL